VQKVALQKGLISILFDLLSFIRVEKILQISPQRVLKEAEFCSDLKNVQNS
jgi:hypothetical protein